MILSWNIYEIKSDSESLHGVMLRGRIRKFSLENEITCLVENASDEENVVRFALLNDSNPEGLNKFIQSLIPAVKIRKVLENIQNPILSKLKVNDTSQYN